MLARIGSSIGRINARGLLWTLAKVALAAALLGIVLAQVRLEDLTALLGNIALPWVPATIGTYWGVVVLTAWRYWALVDRKLPLSQAVGLTVVQTVVGNFIASSAGAVSYVALLRGRHQVQLRQGIASLVLARFGDLLALTLALAAASLVLWPAIAPLRWVVAALLGALVCLVVALGLVFVFRQPLVAAWGRVLAWLRLDRLGLVRRIMAQLSELAAQSPDHMGRAARPFLALSVALMVCNFAFSYSTLRLFGIPLGGWAILFSMAIIQLLAVIPVQVFGGLGVYEVTALYLYGLLGVPAPVAVPLVVSSRLYLWLLNLLLLLYLPLEARLAPDRGGEVAQETS